MQFPPINLYTLPKQLRDYMYRTQNELEEIMVSDHAKAMNEAKGIEATLQERGNRYGPFDGHAAITQSLKRVMADANRTNWIMLSDSQQEALEMIAHKIGRILNGDPNYDDSWRDIAGYATLIEKQLNGESK
jgi:hypothetical protein